MKNEEIIEVLGLSPLFNSLSNEELSLIVTNPLVRIKKYSKEETIFFQMDKCKHLSILIEGIIEIQQNNENGNTLVVTSC